MNSVLRHLLAGATLFATVGAAALPSDSQQPINIEADWAEADDAQRTTVYKGRVVVVQGSIRITGDVVTMFYDTGRELNKLVATGRPARFRQQVDEAGKMQRATASRLEYLVDTDTMVLIGTAELAEGNSQVNAERIVYDTLNGRLKAESGVRVSEDGTSDAPASTGGRVRIVIEPSQN